jgi:dTDP-glucose 4,6-dehydratase
LLVTGGAGFIGSHFVRSVLDGRLPGLAGSPVTVLDALRRAGNPANLDPVRGHPGFRFVQGDIADPQVVAEALPNHDAVLNFAAESSVDRSIAGAAPFVHTNVLGTQTLLDGCLAHRVPRFLQVSTDEVYGSIESGSWTEQSPLAPNSPYAASKAAADLLVRACGRTHGLRVTITRCTNNYGPYQFPEKLVSRFVTNLLDGHRVPLYGDGLHVRDWLHVEDHCRAIALALTAGDPGEIYNVGGGTELTNRQLTERLLAVCGAGWDRVELVPDRKAHDRRYSVDFAKLAALGYAPRVDFDEGLAATVAWYRDNRAWWEPLRGR